MKRFVLFCVAGLLLSGPASAQESASELRWNLKKGEVLRYRHVIDQSFEIGSTAYRQRIEVTERLEVKEARPNGEYVLLHSILSARVTIGGVAVYDSAAPQKADPHYAALFRDILGTSRRFAMDALGRPAQGKGPAIAQRFDQVFAGRVGAGIDGPMPLAVVALPLPEGTRKTWEVKKDHKHDAGFRFAVRTVYAPDASGRVHGAIDLSLKGAPSEVKLTRGSGTHEAEFRGVLRRSLMEFTVALERKTPGQTLRVVNSMKNRSELVERSRK